MAINSKDVEQAISILKRIKKGIGVVTITDGGEYSEMIHKVDPKVDGGYESIYATICNATVEQLQLFDDLKGELHNTSFSGIHPDDSSITRMGWY